MINSTCHIAYVTSAYGFGPPDPSMIKGKVRVAYDLAIDALLVHLSICLQKGLKKVCESQAKPALVSPPSPTSPPPPHTNL